MSIIQRRKSKNLLKQYDEEFYGEMIYKKLK